MAGGDRRSARWCSLQPGKRTATERFHRRIIETRDALTQLSPYLSEDFEIADDDTRVTMLYRCRRFLHP